MTNKVIQWDCCGQIESSDFKHNHLAVCLQETDIITVRRFNPHNKFKETESRASGRVSILVNDNISQSIVILNTNLQVVAVKVTAHKTITTSQ